MLMAARKLQGIGLVLIVLAFAMIIYPVSLKVAATRSELAQISKQVVRTRDNIRYLESELAVRASLRQLEQWNAETFGYSAPSASQYLENERQLSSLGRLPRARGANEVAPVLMAMVSPVDMSNAPGAPASEDAAPAATKKADKADKKDAAKSGSDKAGADKARPVLAVAAKQDVSPRMAQTRRREQLKLIEDQLLAETTLTQAKRKAARDTGAKAKP